MHSKSSGMARPENLIVIGGGEHARVVIEVARSRPELWNVLGFADSSSCDETCRRLNIRRVGNDEEVIANHGSSRFVLGVGGIGTPGPRESVADYYQLHNIRWAVVVHALAWVSPTAELGPGTVVGAGVIVNSGAVIKEHCLINTGAIIEHDVQLGAFSQVGPGAVVGGGAIIGKRSYLGLGCRIRDHIQVDCNVLVGMGAVVIESVASGQSVVGIPAKAVRKRCTPN